MTLRYPIALALLGATTTAWSMSADRLDAVEIEAGIGSITSNTAQRPNDAAGTRFDFDDFAHSQVTTARVTLDLPTLWGTREADWLITLAPLQQSGTGTPHGTIRYQGATFTPAAPLTGLYQFNTYRVTYDVRIFAEAADWEFRVGGTLALRDAQIRLTQGATRRNFINWGPVPLAYGYLARRLGEGWRFSVSGDAFPAPGGGGLLDVAAKLTAQVGRHGALYAGVRQLSGGASGSDLYTSLHLTEGIVGLEARW